MKFSLRNLILVNVVTAMALGAILGNPIKSKVNKNQDKIRLIHQARKFGNPISDEEIQQFLRQQAADLKLAQAE